MNNTEQLLNRWLKDKGLNAKNYYAIPLNLAKAQITAHELMTKHQAYLTKEEINKLKTFQMQLRFKSLINKISISRIYFVLNLGKKINRQEYKANKQR